MEIFIILLALGVSTVTGAGIGFFVATQWQFYLKINRKEDYEAKIKELDKLMADLLVVPAETEVEQYSAYDMFPPNINPEYGLPKAMKR
jgi:hypothetical protein